MVESDTVELVELDWVVIGLRRSEMGDVGQLQTFKTG